MKYKLIGSNDYLADPIATVLTNRGVEDHDKLLHVNEGMVLDPYLLDNMGKAVECVIEHFEKGSHVALIVDSDGDGYTSASIFYNYLKDLYFEANISFLIHPGKEHGLEKDMMTVLESPEMEDVKLLVIPDAGSGSEDLENYKILKERDIDIVVLDHHNCDKPEGTHAIIVNNQISDNYPNKMLSGAGIVYKFCQAMDMELEIGNASRYLDLVAVGNIGDLVDTRSLETRYFITQGMKQVRNPFLKALITKQAYSMKNIININTVTFYVVPLINACVRYGSMEEKINMFHAFINSDMYLPFTPRGSKSKGSAVKTKTEKKEEVQQHITVAMARICGNIKARQDKAKEKGLETLRERIEEKNLLQNKILIINGTGIIEPTMTGVIASSLAERYKRPVVILKKYKDDLFGGSARGYTKSELQDFRTFLCSTDCFESVDGHDNAFGIKIKKCNLVPMCKRANEMLKDMTFENVHLVDFLIPAKQLNGRIVTDLSGLINIWGKGVEEPLLAVTKIKVDTKELLLMKTEKACNMKFLYRGIEFIKYRASEEEYEKIKANEVVEFDVVGRCNINEFMGQKMPHINIVDFEYEALEDDIMY